MAAYSRINFGMFGGEETAVKLMFKNEMVGILLDRFGKDITIRKSKEEGYSETIVNVALSDQFFGWIFALGNGVKITAPKEVAQRFADELKDRLKNLYID